jgi:hypothetical protein
MPSDNNPDTLTLGDGPEAMRSALDPGNDLIDQLKLAAETDRIDTPVSIATVSSYTGDLVIRHGSLPFLRAIRHSLPSV